MAFLGLDYSLDPKSTEVGAHATATVDADGSVDTDRDADADRGWARGRAWACVC